MRQEARRERKAIREAQTSLVPGFPVDARHGLWQHVFNTEVVDHLITDPPYSDRTHAGRRTGTETRRSTINYKPMTRRLCRRFAKQWKERVKEFFIVFGDWRCWNWWAESFDEVGLYVFGNPVVWHKMDAAPRYTGDGPNSSCEFICVARQKRWPTVMGSRESFYECATSSTRGGPEDTIPGEKPLELCRRIVRDYTARGQKIGDPFGGRFTFALAAANEGREAITCERSRKTFGMGLRRLRKGYTLTFDAVLDTPPPGLITLPLCTCSAIPVADEHHEKNCMRAIAARAFEAKEAA